MRALEFIIGMAIMVSVSIVALALCKVAEETCRMNLVEDDPFTDVYAAVIAWMEANGYEAAEPMFNIYHVSPHETQNPDEFVTEICYPVKKK